MNKIIVTSDSKILTTFDNKLFVSKNKKEVFKMAKFQFRILTGATEAACKAMYDNLVDSTTHQHDPYTFYLFGKGGVGYLGDTQLFGGDGDVSKFNMISSNITADVLKPNSFYFVTADCTITDGQATPVTHAAKTGSIWVTNASSIPQELSLSIFTTYMTNYVASQAIHSDDASINSDYTGNDTTLMTSGATKALIDAVVNSQTILQISFFKKVELHTITAAEKAAGTSGNGEITCFVDYPEAGDSYTVSLTANDHENDIGLVFMCQTGEEYDETDSDGDECIFVNLHRLITRFIGGDYDTTEVVINQDTTADSSGHTQRITVNVKESQKTAAALEDIIINAVGTVNDHKQDPETYPNDYDKTNATDALAQHRFITESQLVDILGHVLTHFAEVTWVNGGGEGMEEGENN